MQKTENLSYIPLEIEVVEVLMEKGYAGSGGTEGFTEGTGEW